MNNSSNCKLKHLVRQKDFLQSRRRLRFLFIFLSNKSFISIKLSNYIIIEKLFMFEFEFPFNLCAKTNLLIKKSFTHLELKRNKVFILLFFQTHYMSMPATTTLSNEVKNEDD
jgi:hypothetical protein